MSTNKPTRPDVKAILDYLAAHLLTVCQAAEQLQALGVKAEGVAGKFLHGELSYNDVFHLAGV